MSLSQVYHTVKSLQFDQIWWQVKYRSWRRLFPAQSRPAPEGLARRAGLDRRTPFLWFLTGPGTKVEEKRFDLLNDCITYSGTIDWNASSRSRLWAFNLNYFDFLAGVDRETGTRTILDWIAGCVDGTGWESAPMSCRIVNWIKFIDEKGVSRFEANVLDRICASLFTQADRLSLSPERHIGGNHLLKNGVALVFAGLFLKEERLTAKGLGILAETLDEQFLADGVHFERSTMYHAMVMVDLLDCINIGAGDADLREKLEQTSIKGLWFLRSMTHRDGGISLFNDANFGVAPSTQAISGYADRVLGADAHRTSDPPAISFPEAGYFILSSGEARMIVDAGPIGPDHFPAHGHCDLLSYELSLGDRRIVVDSGNFDYEAGDIRQYCRSTRAHNTVTIDGHDQCDLWGIFRVGRRSIPEAAGITTCDGAQVFNGAYRVETNRLKARHCRRIIAFPQGIYLVLDFVEGTGRHLVTSYVHFHPDCRLTAGPSGVDSLTVEAGQARIGLRGCLTGGESRLETGWYCPAFSVKQRQHVLAMSQQGDLPTTIAYCIGNIPEGPAKLDLDRSSLVIGDVHFTWHNGEGAISCAS